MHHSLLLVPSKLTLLSQSSTQLIDLASKSLNSLNDALQKIIFLLKKKIKLHDKSLTPADTHKVDATCFRRFEDYLQRFARLPT